VRRQRVHRPVDRLERHRLVLAAPPPEHHRPPGARLVQKVLQQGRLPEARASEHRHHFGPGAFGPHRSERPAQRRELLVAPD
jgi:hypothetical protein